MAYRNVVQHAKDVAERAMAASKARASSHDGTAGEEDPQLPLWPDDCRGVPNEIVRSALFNAKNRRSRREFIKDAPLFVIGEGSVTYRGEELRQDDQDVWMGVLHLMRNVPLGAGVSFIPHQFLNMINWPTSKLYYDRLRESLDRMKATSVKVYSGRLKKGVALSLIKRFEWLGEDGGKVSEWQVWLEPEIQQLFAPMYYTLVDWEQRRRLSPLAKWLQGMLASHRDPYPIKIETIAKGAGLDTSRKDNLKSSLSKALEALVKAGFLVDWEIRGDLVIVRRGRRQPEPATRTLLDNPA